jgi:hypothetical protein
MGRPYSVSKEPHLGVPYAGKFRQWRSAVQGLSRNPRRALCSQQPPDAGYFRVPSPANFLLNFAT